MRAARVWFGLLFALLVWTGSAHACGWYGDGDSDDDDDVVWVDAQGVPIAAATKPDATSTPRALTKRGNLYRKGSEGVAQNFVQAARWYRLAAERGFAPAQNNLAMLYEQGLGVARDQFEAARWYRKAAEQGNAAAAHSLGQMLLEGRGVIKNRGEGLRWIRVAAEHGHRSAMMELAGLLFTGPAKTRDRVEAYRWWRAAAVRGDPAAPARLKSARAVMTAAEVAQAESSADLVAKDDSPDVAQHRLGAAEAISRWRTAGKDLAVLDVRTAEEYVYGRHVPGAYNVPVMFLEPRWNPRTDGPVTRLNREFLSTVKAKIKRGRPLMVICRTGERSAYAVKRLLSAGFQQVFDVQGGFNAWLAAGGPSSSSLDREHIYQRR